MPRWLGREAATRVAPVVLQRTAGNAFVVEEVLRELSAGGSEDSIPESVPHAVSARLARLSEEAVELLAIAAVLGLQIREPVVANEPQVAEAAPDELLAGPQPARLRTSARRTNQIGRYRGLFADSSVQTFMI